MTSSPQVSGTTLCAHCATPGVPGARFCGACGTPAAPPQPLRQGTICGGCASPLSVGAPFCGSCGTPAQPIPRMIVPNPLPQSVVAPIAAGANALRNVNWSGQAGQYAIVAVVLFAAGLTSPAGVGILLLGALIYGFSQGFRNRVVLFYDTKDALIACVCAVGCFLAVFWAPLWVLVAVMALWTARNAMKNLSS